MLIDIFIDDSVHDIIKVDNEIYIGTIISAV